MVLRVDEKDVLDSLQKILAVDQAALPADVEIRGVYFEHQRQRFCFVLHHPSFPPVPTGSIIPEIPFTRHREAAPIGQ